MLDRRVAVGYLEALENIGNSMGSNKIKFELFFGMRRNVVIYTQEEEGGGGSIQLGSLTCPVQPLQSVWQLVPAGMIWVYGFTPESHLEQAGMY